MQNGIKNAAQVLIMGIVQAQKKPNDRPDVDVLDRPYYSLDAMNDAICEELDDHEAFSEYLLGAGDGNMLEEWAGRAAY